MNTINKVTIQNIKELNNEELLELQDLVDIELNKREKEWLIVLNK